MYRTLCVFLSVSFTFNNAVGSVPWCCPKGQRVAELFRINGEDQFNCTDTSSNETLELVDNLHVHQYQLPCPNITASLIPYKISNNVTLASKIEKLSIALNETDNCFDIPTDRPYLAIYSCYEEDDSSDISIEVQKSNKSMPDVRWTYTICSGLSIVLLISAAVTYSSDENLKNNPHSPYIVSHNVALAIVYLCRITLQFIAVSEDSTNCKLMGFTMQLFTLSVFFWMNAMYMDIYITLRRMIPSLHRFDAKFFFLAMYAWGIPLLITITSILAEYLDVVPQGSQFKPNMARGGHSCFFTGNAKWIYFKGPIFFTVAVNITLFTLTAVGFYQHRKSADFLQPNSRLRSERRFFFVYVKLFILMGLCWNFGWLLDTGINIVLPALGIRTLPSLKYIFVLIDMVFCLHGVLIFLLLLWKKKSLGMVIGHSISIMDLVPRSKDLKKDDEENVAFSEMMVNTPM